MFVSDYYVQRFLNVALETIDDKFFSRIEIPKNSENYKIVALERKNRKK